MPKEVALFRLKKTEIQKKIDQQIRLMGEFPWLWAIKPHWRPGYDTIKVESCLGGALEGVLSGDRPVDLWMLLRLEDMLGLKRVYRGLEPNWASACMRAFKAEQPCVPLYLTVGDPVSTNQIPVTFTIFRPKFSLPDEILCLIEICKDRPRPLR